MSIIATNSGVTREPVPAGNYIARCYRMIHVGTVEETIQGVKKMLNKVRIGWELPEELKSFKEGEPEKPLVIDQEYTLSMNEKANLRKMLASWRGKDFTEDEAKAFDVTKLIGAACMLNIIHKESGKGNTYEQIGSVSPLPKSTKCPAQINKSSVLQYDNFDWGLFDSLPDFIKDRIKTSQEFIKLSNPGVVNTTQQDESFDDLPF